MRYDETELAPQTTQKYLLGPVINKQQHKLKLDVKSWRDHDVDLF